ncbi:hypothetical protein BKA70DRAFT_1537538 [Coprinopsis sp. MPI-PUGE-AT-0042]|nr:hypothetical protein BKA70DRAFT_1537538 [Coprinopsis sp. MPI-PUGE-AT-0042]
MGQPPPEPLHKEQMGRRQMKGERKAGATHAHKKHNAKSALVPNRTEDEEKTRKSTETQQGRPTKKKGKGKKGRLKAEAGSNNLSYSCSTYYPDESTIPTGLTLPSLIGAAAPNDDPSFHRAVHTSDLEYEISSLTYELEDAIAGKLPTDDRMNITLTILQMAMRTVMRYCRQNRNRRWRIDHNDVTARFMDTMIWMLRTAIGETEDLNPEY